jgi:predicted branched-subunit amino acid permease
MTGSPPGALIVSMALPDWTDPGRTVQNRRMDDSPAGAHSPVPFTAAGAFRGIRDSLPLAASVLVYGVVFGLLAKTAQISLAEAMLMSALVFSGSAQMVAVNGMEGASVPAGAAAFAVMTTILLLNARYLLYGAAMRPWLGQVPPLQAYGSLAVLGDGNWLLSMKARNGGERDAGYIFGSGAAMFLPWMLGTAAGMLAGGFAADPRALGLDFMLIAFSAALAAGMLKGRPDMLVLGAGTVAAVLAERLLPAGWTVLCAAAAGGVTAWVRFRPEPIQGQEHSA